MRDPLLGLNHDLGVVAIGAAEETHPLELLGRQGRHVVAADELDPATAAAVGEGRVFPIRLELPTGDLILD
jgi:hypothetical protein